MRGTLWITGIIIALFALPLTVAAQENDGTYYNIKVKDYPPSNPPPITDPRERGDSYYRDADPNYEKTFQANVQAYKERMTGGHHEHTDNHFTQESLNDLAHRARGGDKFALQKLGDAYASGNGVKKNEQKALEWYEMGARLGHNMFFSRIGDLYRERYEPPQSMLQRLKSYVSSDEATIERDNRIALVWYEKGRVWGDAKSFMALSDFYAQGLGGLEKDEENARIYRHAGVQMMKKEDHSAERDFEMAARKYASEVTPFNPQYNDDQPAQALAGQQVLIAGQTCYYTQSQEDTKGYDFIYRAQCSNVLNRTAMNEQVGLPGMLCDVSIGSQPTSAVLKCSVTGGETITVAGLECSLRNETPDKGFAAVFGAYCQGDAKPSREKVIYKNMECIPDRVYTQGGKQYTLYCNPIQAAPVQQAQPVGRDTPVNIGNFSCVAAERTVSSGARRISYDVNCGGIAATAKTGPQVPRLIPFGEFLCDVAPVENRDKVDFTMECRK